MIRALMALLLLSGPAHAHDWLEGKYSQDGQLCCFATESNGRIPDCAITTARPTADGWLVQDIWVDKVFRVPDKQVMPSQDGEWWLCRMKYEPRPRCIFGPNAGV